MIFLQLEDSVIRNFAKAVTNSNDFTETSGVLYGTVKKNDSDTYVVLDGSNLETPVVTAMDAEDGDRVMVSIVNHVATITGNITSPASARTASSYMKLTDEGLIVGRLVNGNPVGSYCLIGLKDEDKVNYSDDTEFYYIMNPDNSIAARFGDDIIDLGITKESIIALCSGRAEIRSYQDYSYSDDEPGPVIVEMSTTANSVQERSHMVFTAKHFYDKETSSLYGNAELRVENNTGANRNTINPCVELIAQNGVYEDSNETSEKYKSASLIITPGYIQMRSDNIDSTIFKKKYITVTGTIESGSYKRFFGNASIDAGYTLIGIIGITNNHSSVAHLTQFYVSGNTLNVTFHNHHSSALTDMSINIHYLLIKTAVQHLT